MALVSRTLDFLLREWLLFAYSILFVLLFVSYHPAPSDLLSYIYFRALLSIFGFLVVVQGLSDSGFLRFLANRAALWSGDARAFALASVFATAFLAVFVTNDLALFTFVPIILAAPLDESLKFRTLVLLALAANVGAFLSPIGNPQRIFLWQMSGLSFLEFLRPFVLPFLVLLAGLVGYTVFLIPHVPISPPASKIPIHRRAARQDAVVFAGYLLLLFAGQWAVAVALALLYFLIVYPAVFKRIDWPFVFLLLFLFTDFGMLSNHFNVARFIPASILSSVRGTFLASAILTQLFSDVPTAILLSQYSHHYVAIAMGTTVGAMGLIVASIANIIAVRLSTERRKYLKFHIYSLPFFLFALSAVLLFL